MSNKKLYLRARGLTINPQYGKGGTADFTSRELDKLAQSVQTAESVYYQHLKENQMPIDTGIPDLPEVPDVPKLD